MIWRFKSIRFCAWHLSLVSIIACAAITPAYAQNKTWTIDTAKSSVQFLARRGQHFPGKGKFTGITGTLKYDGKNLAGASVNATVSVASIKTDVNKRDLDLKSRLYFDVQRFPIATFRSKSISKKDDKYLLIGDFTLHGVTKTIGIKMGKPKIEVQKDGTKVLTAGGAAEIDQPEFGLSLRKLHPDNVLVAEDIVLVAVAIRAVQQISPFPPKGK